MSIATYWDFADQIRLTNRYVLDGRCRRFLQRLSKEAKSRLVTLQPTDTYYRAQINNPFKYLVKVGGPADDPVTAPLPPERMIPSNRYAEDGRINPRGIAYLYLADTVETAIAEIRPIKDEAVTVGLFAVGAACDVVDCRRRDGDSPDWSAINHAMRFPAGREESWRIYLPTQCIAEYLRSEGYNGLLYGSAMNDTGYSVALFDTSAAQLNGRRLLRVRGVTYNVERDEIFPDDVPPNQSFNYIDLDNFELD